MSISDNDYDSSIHDDDPDPRFISPAAKCLPSWPIRSSIVLSPDQPQCVLSLTACNHSSQLAALTSDYTLRLHDPDNLKQIGHLSYHTDQVRAVRSIPDSSALVTASEDGSWKLVDLRTGSVQLSVQTDQSLYSFDCNGVLAAAGIDIQGEIAIWDIRNCSVQLGSLSEFHTDEVRDIRFHPVSRSILFSGSVDCLINKFDLNASSLDDALVSVFNTNQSIRSFQFFGPSSEYLYSISEIETLSLCNLLTDDLICSIDDICERLSSSLSVRYLIDCYYDPEQRSLSVFAGNYYGDIMGSLISAKELDPALTLFNGHNSGVRAMTSIGNVLFTAGEDSRIVSWVSNIHR